MKKSPCRRFFVYTELVEVVEWKKIFMKFSDYTIKNIEEVLKELETSEKGLLETEAANRLKVYGPNEVKAKEVGSLDIFLRQFKSPFIYLLFIAAVIAFIIGEMIEGGLILAFVFFNVLFGFLQEAKAQKAISLLKKYLLKKVKVRRNALEKEIEEKLLVPGDIVLLEAGDIIPADLRIFQIKNFVVDESILTGESQPVAKIAKALKKETKEIFEAKNIVFSGTSVISGNAQGIIINTGKNTVFGKITKLVNGTARGGIYEKNLLNFSRLILRIVLITIISVYFANLIIKKGEGLSEFSIFSIALVVSIIPEALPLVANFSLSQGALKLAKEKVIVKRLTAIEDLGDIEILCTDKTGTITENKLVLDTIFSQNQEKCLLYGLSTPSVLKEKINSIKNPFDLALIQAAPENIKESLKKLKLLSEVPFDPSRLRSSVLLEDSDGKRILISRGAPEIILKLSKDFDGNLSKESIKEKIEKEGNEGKRVLAVAFKEFEKNDFKVKDEKNLIFLGYFSFKDPLKKTAKETAVLAKKLGLKLKILTGDSKEVAGFTAKEIGLIEDERKVITGAEMDDLSEEEFAEKCQEFSVFARVSPETKYNIVKELSKVAEVGFLGDGINDIPALKVSRLAVVVNSAADVTKEVSDIVLLKKDLRVLINGIWEGRNIFSNINKYIKVTLASNFGNFYSIAFISLLIPFLPMLPAQILLVNLLSDFPLIAVASDRVDVEELRKPKLYQLNRFILLIFLLGLVSTAFDFIFFGLFHNAQPGLIQTLWFMESILTEILLIFSVRTSHLFFKAKGPSFLLIVVSLFAVAVSIFLPFSNIGKEALGFVSPPFASLLIVFSLLFFYFIASEMVKLFYFRYWHNRNLPQSTVSRF